MGKDLAINQNNFKFGLSGSAIKYIAVVLMVFDHIHQMFYAWGAPLWFVWLGRPVLPVFLFTCAEGFVHTRSRKRYLLRLFIGFECMNVISLLLNRKMPVDGVILINNVFQTMLLSGLYILFIENFCAGILHRQPLKAALSVGLMMLPIAVSLCVFMISDSSHRLLLMLCMFIPNVLFTEGSVVSVLLGVAFYLLRKKPWAQALVLAALSVIVLIVQIRNGDGLFSGGAQWLMVLAVIPILLYNGRRGHGNKYFFYIFYPAHIYLFYVIAWLLQFSI